MLKFCFPERDPDQIDGEASEEMYETQSLGGGGFSGRSSSASTSSAPLSKKNRSKKGGKDTNFYIKIDQKDDVEKMKVFFNNWHETIECFINYYEIFTIRKELRRISYLYISKYQKCQYV